MPQIQQTEELYALLLGFDDICKTTLNQIILLQKNTHFGKQTLLSTVCHI